MKKLGKGCLFIVAAVLVLGVVGAVLGSRSGSSGGTLIQPTAAPPSSGSNAAPVEATTAPTKATTAFRVGDDVRVADVRWKVITATDMGATLKSSNSFVKDKTTGGHFVQVQFELENLSKDMLTFAGLDLVDDQGRTFKSSSEVFQFIPSEEACVLENLNPNVAKRCTAIYELPSNAAGLKAQVSDLKLVGNDSALIDLGLSGK